MKWPASSGLSPTSRGRFRTFPQGAASFKLAFASCGDPRDPDQRGFDAILEEQPLVFVHMGDLHYSDTNSTNLEDYRSNYDRVLKNPNEGALYRGVPIAYMWDDHDFVGDNGTGADLGAATARAVYREYVPHYPINAPGGSVAQAFTVGRVRIIMTDLRSASMSQNAPETAAKTRMGVGQKAWFKQELIAARDADYPLILWVSTTPWIDPPALGSDTWAGYATERTEIANFLRDNSIKNIVVLSGDLHALAYDDGTHSDYATGGGAPLVVFHAAALSRSGDAKGGPYTAGPFLNYPQYGVIEVTDNGGPVMQCRFTGKRVGEGAKVVFQFTASVAGIVRRSTAVADNGSERALVNLSFLGRINNVGETVIVGFVVGGRSPRNILLRAAGPSLAPFGLSDAIKRPVLTLFQDKTVIASNDDWGLADAALLTGAFDRAGAFRFAGTASHDAAIFVTLQPGAYTMQGRSRDGSTGPVLLEAYEVP